MQRVFRSDKAFDCLWRGHDLFAWLDGSRYHVHDELGQAKEHPTQIACRPKLAALRLDRVEMGSRRVLDVGCNSGWFANECLKLGAADVLGLDTSPRACVLAEQLLRHAYGWSGFRAVNRDILDFGGGPFDVILATSMFHYVRDKTAFFRTLAHLLAPGGTAVLETPVHKGGEDVLIRDRVPKQYVPSVEHVRRLGRSVGLEATHFGPSNLPERRVFHFRRPPPHV